MTPKRLAISTAIIAGALVIGVAGKLTIGAISHAILVNKDLKAFSIVPHFNQTSTPPTITDTTVSTQAAATTIKRQFGISLGNTLYGMPAETLNKQLDDMQSIGITWIRVDIGWDDVQAGGPTTYSWANTDRIIAAANARQINVLPVLAYTPAWARPAGCRTEKCAPANNQAFATFAAQAVARYKAQNVHAWEVWNEPNIDKFWQPRPNATNYTKLLNATYASIKAADSSAIVVSAGLSPAEDSATTAAPRTYLTAMYKAGAKGGFDVLGLHPYSYPAPASTQYGWSAWSQTFDLNPSIRSIMDANGDTAKAIWITEYGAPTGGSGSSATISTYSTNQDAGHVDEDLQSYILQASVSSLVQRDWSGVFFWYSYQDLGQDQADNENFFGILRSDGTQKKSYTVLKQILANPQ